MKKHYYLSFLFITFLLQLSYSQTKKVEYYKNGQNGIEIISKNKVGTTIISTYDAKITIKDEVAKRFFEYYQKNPNIADSIIKIKAKSAIVYGECKISKNKNLTNVGFYYKRIEWKDGLIEEHSK